MAIRTASATINIASSKQHYEAVLSPVYSWMYGGFASALQRNTDFFAQRGLSPAKSGIAVDHDLVYKRTDGQWELSESYYRKLRLSPQWVVDELAAAGFTDVQSDSDKGLITIVAANR